MTIFLLILFGFLAGIIGGMGMGGGTLLVPLLSFLDIPQKTIQAINLLSFLPMSLVALWFHKKNGLLEKQNLSWLTYPAIAAAVGGSILTAFVDDKILRICFAVFLIAIGTWQMYIAVKCVVNKKKDSIYCEDGRIGKEFKRNHPSDFLEDDNSKQ